MYKLLFVVVLAAASFAGGAAVHSRGPGWARELIQSQLGGAEAGDPPMGGEIPSEPLSPLDIEPTSPKPAAVPTPPKPAPAAADSSGPEAPAAPEPKAPEPLDPKALGLGDGPSEMKPPAPLAEAPAPPLLPSPVPPSDGPPVLEAPAGLLRPKGRESAAPGPKGGDSPQAASTLPRVRQDPPVGDPAAPPPVPAPEPPAPDVDSGGPANVRPPASWAELRRSMRELGVSQYVIEGEPGGRARFHCLIPVAGNRAVAQRFEAEADDEFQAAEVAIRRINLWRATEAPDP